MAYYSSDAYIVKAPFSAGLFPAFIAKAREKRYLSYLKDGLSAKRMLLVSFVVVATAIMAEFLPWVIIPSCNGMLPVVMVALHGLRLVIAALPAAPACMVVFMIPVMA